MTTLPLSTTIASVYIGAGLLRMTLTDGRRISVPLSWFPRLANATASERGTWEFSADRTAIHWPAVDEDISVRVLLGLPS